MSTVKADTIHPKDFATDLTLGASGDTVSIAADDLRVNTVKDKGGNTLWTSDGSGTLSSLNSGLKGNLILLSSPTGSSSSGIAFTTQLTSTYDIYCFKFLDINPSAYANFQFNGSTDTGATYAVTKTTSYFSAEHYESGSSYGLYYRAGNDLANSTSYQMIFQGMDNDADDSASGELWLFAPLNTTYVKHFQCTGNYKAQSGNGLSTNFFLSGYFDTTSAIDSINFQMASGTFDGTISMYGLL